MINRRGLLLLFAIPLLLAACAKTRQVGDLEVPNAGFLGAYYAKLTPGDEDKYEPALRWYSPDYDLRKYNKLMLDPILIYRGKEGRDEGVAPEDAQHIADYFYNKAYTTLQDDIEMVNRPGPKTIRLTVAMTSLEQSTVVLDTVSSIHVGARLLTEVGGVVGDKPAFVGAAAIEAKVVDAHTGKVLAVAMDKRVGGKTLGKGFSEWSDVMNAIDYWAVVAKYRLCKGQGRADCMEP